MKKVFACTLIALGCMAGTAHASTGEVRFVGSVTETTCDLVPEVGGSVNSVLQLGTAKIDGKAGEKAFKLTPNPAQADCTALPDDKVATISWSAANLTENGLGNQSGEAVDAWVNIKTKNADGAQIDINSTNHAADFLGANLKVDGAMFTAELNGGKTAGEFASAAAFVVAYK